MKRPVAAGVKHFVASGVTADAAVVGEPTSLEVVRAHRGGTFWRIRTLGTAAHSSMPQRGDNAIFRMTDLIQVLRREFERRLQGRVHPLVGPSTFSAGAIHAGTSVNMVPDHCDLVFERRSLPGEAIDDIERELFDVIELARAEHAGLRVEVRAQRGRGGAAGHAGGTPRSSGRSAPPPRPSSATQSSPERPTAQTVVCSRRRASRACCADRATSPTRTAPTSGCRWPSSCKPPRSMPRPGGDSPRSWPRDESRMSRPTMGGIVEHPQVCHRWAGSGSVRASA